MLARFSTGGLSAGDITGDFPQEHRRVPGLLSMLGWLGEALMLRGFVECEGRLTFFCLGISHGDAFFSLFGKK